MKVPTQKKLLKIYISAAYFTGSIPVYEAILYAAKEAGLIGATLIKGSMGLGHLGRIESKETYPNYDTFPMLIEIIDIPEKVENFIPVAANLLGNHGIIAATEVTVYHP